MNSGLPVIRWTAELHGSIDSKNFEKADTKVPLYAVIAFLRFSANDFYLSQMCWMLRNEVGVLALKLFWCRFRLFG